MSNLHIFLLTILATGCVHINAPSHKVTVHDSLEIMAYNYNMSVEKILNLNNLSGDYEISIGEELIIEKDLEKFSEKFGKPSDFKYKKDSIVLEDAVTLGLMRSLRVGEKDLKYCHEMFGEQISNEKYAFKFSIDGKKEDYTLTPLKTSNNAYSRCISKVMEIHSRFLVRAEDKKIKKYHLEFFVEIKIDEKNNIYTALLPKAKRHVCGRSKAVKKESSCLPVYYVKHQGNEFIDKKTKKSGLEREEVKTGINLLTPKFQRCYRKSPDVKKKQTLSLMLKILIDFSGRAKKVNIIKSDNVSDYLKTCVISVFETDLELPSPKGREPFYITYPLVFLNE